MKEKLLLSSVAFPPGDKFSSVPSPASGRIMDQLQVSGREMEHNSQGDAIFPSAPNAARFPNFIVCRFILLVQRNDDTEYLNLSYFCHEACK